VLSLVRSSQTPLQFVRPAEHDVVHTLPTHFVPAAHFVPQAPQLASSLVVSRQTPEQFVRPPPQLTAHLPALQI